MKILQMLPFNNKFSNGIVGQKGFLSLHIIDSLDQIFFVCVEGEGVPCALLDVQQHLWPLPTRWQQYPCLSVVITKMSPNTAKNLLGRGHSHPHLKTIRREKKDILRAAACISQCSVAENRPHSSQLKLKCINDRVFNALQTSLWTEETDQAGELPEMNPKATPQLSRQRNCCACLDLDSACQMEKRWLGSHFC